MIPYTQRAGKFIRIVVINISFLKWILGGNDYIEFELENCHCKRRVYIKGRDEYNKNSSKNGKQNIEGKNPDNHKIIVIRDSNKISNIAI